MITLEQLQENSSKTSLTQFWEGYTKKYGKPPVGDRRHPDTIISGVLTPEQINEYYEGLLKERYTLTNGEVEELGNASFSAKLLVFGFTVSANDTHCFLTDDSQFGYPVIQERGFISCTHGGGLPAHVTPREKYPDGELRTMDQFLDVFYRDLVLLKSNQELLDYLNS